MAKHLPDKFHLIGDQRVSLRSKIFREVIANLIVHREYTNAQPASLIIYRDRVETTNPNNPHGKGIISPDNFTPFSKNPLIAKFFIQLGRVDELGSGILNVNKYLKDYSGKSPEFIEDNTFRVIIPLVEGEKPEVEGEKPEVEGEKPEVEGEKPEVEGEILLIRQTVNGIKELRKDTKAALESLILCILKNEGKKAGYYSLLTDTPPKSNERYLKILRENKIIEFIGHPKAKGSGYFLKEDFRNKIRPLK